MPDGDSYKVARTILEESTIRFRSSVYDDDDEFSIYARLFLDHVDLVVHGGVMARFSSANPPDKTVYVATMALAFLYARSMSRFPAGFHEGMGDSFYSLAGLSLGYLEVLPEVSARYGFDISSSDLEFVEMLLPFFLGNDMSPENSAFVQNVMEKLGAGNPTEFMVFMLKHAGIDEKSCMELLRNSDRLTQAWFADMVKHVGMD